MPLAQAQSETAMGAPAVAPVNAATDSSVLRLSNAFAETARQIRSFRQHKEYMMDSPLRLKAELKKVGMYLQPMRTDVGTSLTAEQETAALAVLREDPELAPFASAVQKLWQQTLYTSPLAPRYIAKVIAPDVADVLTAGSGGMEEPTEAGRDEMMVYGILAAVALAVVGLVALAIRSQRKKKEEAQERARQAKLLAEKRTEENRKLREEEARRAAEEAAKETIKNANEYEISLEPGEFAMNDDFRDDVAKLEVPNRVPVEDNYTLVFRNPHGEVIQKFKMTKRVVSFGRRAHGSGTADVALNTEDHTISRLHGVMLYRKETSEWLLALNQDSAQNCGDSVRYALLQRAGSKTAELGVVFAMKPGDMVYFLSPDDVQRVAQGEPRMHAAASVTIE